MTTAYSPLHDPELILAALHQAPMGLALVRDHRIVWINAYLASALLVEPEALLGKSRSELPGSLAALLDEQGEELAMTRPDGTRRLLRRHVADLPAHDATAHFFKDITERRALEAEREHLQTLVATLDTRDPETGLKNRHATIQALEGQISRSRRYGNPFAVIRLTLRPPPAAAAPARTLREIAQEFNSQLRWADEIGRLDDATFLLVLPETPLRDAEELVAKLEHDRIALSGRAEGWSISFAVTDWRAGDDARKLLARLNTSAK